MLATRVRDRPCSALLSRSSLGRFTAMLPSSLRSIVIGVATVWFSSPFGPFTVTSWPSIETSTPDGTVMGSLPMRDMRLPPQSSSPDVGEDFPADALVLRLPVGQQTVRGGDDRHPESAEHARQPVRLRVHPKARLADPAQARDRPLPVGSVLQRDHQGLADHVLGRVLDRPGGDVALLLQDLGHARLQLAVRDPHSVVIGLVAVAQTGQHVCDGVRHRHGCFATFPPRFPLGSLRTRADLQRSRRTTPSPAALRHTGQLAAVRHLTQAHPAQPELAVDRLRPATPLAAGVRAHLELGLAGRLDDQRCLSHVDIPSRHTPGAGSLHRCRFAARVPICCTVADSFHRSAKGKPSLASSARPSSSLLAVVTIVTSLPRTWSILSWSTSRNITCSSSPNV